MSKSELNSETSSSWINEVTKSDYRKINQIINEISVSVVDGYEPLFKVLLEALNQAQIGKGAKCHANGKPFLKQPIMTGARECGPGSMAYQARKKILEALNCDDDDRAITDMLGAINYTAAMIILRRETINDISHPQV